MMIRYTYQISNNSNMDLKDETLQMHLLHDYTTNSIKSQTKGTKEIYKLLLDYLRTKNFRHFKCLVEQNLKKQPFIININYAYPNQSNETCLDIACKNGLSEFVKFLLEKGAKVNRINEVHNRGPIHFATENGHADVLSILLDEPTINPNLEVVQQTALHMAVKKNDLKCASLLLEKGASPNIPNNKGLTALHIAAMKDYRNMVNLILEKTKHALNLDTYKDFNNQTTRQILQKKIPNILLPPIEKQNVNIHDLKYYLNANDEVNFLRCLKIVQNDVLNNDIEKLIEMAVQKNFKEAIILLLERTKEIKCNLEKAANLAIQRGSPHILRRILETDIEIKSDLLLNACIELNIPHKTGSEDMNDRLECFNLILEREDVDVRCIDGKGNTPLHYAAKADCREAVTLLLEKGSYIGHMNNFGIPPVADISISTLSQYFDDCIVARKERTNEYTIEFDYKCLMPHDNSYIINQQKNFKNQEKREMDIFQYIASNNNTQMSTNSSEQMNGEIKNSISIYILQIFTGIVTALLAFREILQLFSSPCHYMSCLENWIEMTLIILGFSILTGATTQVAAVTILLSAWELVILIGKHPRMSTGIEMFKTVFFNFMRFLFLYAFLILAFALAFFVLFKDGGNENFPDPGHSLFKTIIMLTGEFDANDIPFVSHPILSHFVFILFVFLIAIVLFNLLNGLAVSDTVNILEKAELVGLISRIRILAYIENVIIQAPFTHGSYCLICCNLLYGWRYNPLAFLIQKILLFPNYLNNGKLSVISYDSLETYKNKLYDKVELNKNSQNKMIPTFKMDPDIIKQAKDILMKKGQESDSEKIFNELEKLEKRFVTIEITLNSIKNKIENNNCNILEHEN
ncbi:Transient receptor potential cation channel protein painless [Apis cerana cerana]|uniref:Transient receptor potential cation channel protein painless n=1 Tax=Apis cerana cerana TaxID=94128 RepID=A0A2A3EKQ4_APICC|nr:Transient receptor potential cation channel protein painless [Apis cerana cerana]